MDCFVAEFSIGQAKGRDPLAPHNDCKRQDVIFTSAASNAAAALGKSNASALSAGCFCFSVAVG
jgi:hypothetical protein